MDPNLLKLIEYAVKAPSGHNTQPWKFSLSGKSIKIFPDYSRRLSVVDPDDHALFISLGCALENMVIAATHFSYETNITVNSDNKPNFFIQVDLKPDINIPKDELFNYIEKRQVTRCGYKPEKVKQSELDLLMNISRKDGIDLLLFTTDEKIKSLEPFIIEGSNRQFSNKNFKNELIHWFRFTKKDAMQTGNGLWTATMGLPNMGKLIGKLVMKYFVTAKSEAKRWSSLINKSAGFALFVTNKNDIPHWINFGRSFQRFGLTAAKLNISHAHVNMPCEEIEVRKRLMQHLNLGDKNPLLLIRFGYSDKLPYSFRRPVESVIQ